MLYESQRLRYFSFKYWPIGTVFLIIMFAVEIIIDNAHRVSQNEITIGTVLLSVIIAVLIKVFFSRKDKWKMLSLNKWKIVIEENGKDVDYL